VLIWKLVEHPWGMLESLKKLIVYSNGFHFDIFILVYYVL
jgi:hypothetical protein